MMTSNIRQNVENVECTPDFVIVKVEADENFCPTNEDSKTPKTEFVELSGNEENKYLFEDSVDVGADNLEDPLCFNTCNAENTEQVLNTSLEETQSYIAEVKVEELGEDVFEVGNFFQLSKLNEKQESCTREMSYSSEIGQDFSEKFNDKRNQIISGKDRSYVCEECNRKFSQKSSLVEHRRIHTKEKPYICKECKTGFSHRQTLYRHRRIHTQEKPYECEECKIKCSRKGDLIVHMRIHTQEKPHECKECKKRFRHKGNLNKHMKIHTQDKPYTCKECNKKFSNVRNLKSHMRMHTQEKPYECEKCKRKFSHKSNLKKHFFGYKGKRYECREYEKNRLSSLS